MHSWAPELTFVGVEPFAPCSFDGIDDYTELGKAGERILITTSATECDLAVLVDWEIIQRDP